ncbi:MAG: 6-phosphofructokinase [Saprospiraceae bacterium]|nr:6-phosphofructokinase [Saprospiraceae bacterium]
MKNIAVFTSGGDSPGMNACIRAVVRTGLHMGLKVFGIRNGYEGMIDGEIFEMNAHSVSGIIQQGGTILRSARSPRFMTQEGRKRAASNLREQGIEGLVAIGGDGTFTGANVFLGEFPEFSIMGAPGTIDNDLFGTDYTIGYDTAINTAMAAIDNIKDTANAHSRLFFVEVMGRDAGFIALRSAISTGAEAVLIPESKTNVQSLIDTLKDSHSNKKNASIVIVAEGDDAGGAFEIADLVKQHIDYRDVRVTILGHVQRGGRPTCMERVRASQMGVSAVRALLDGESGKMVGIVHRDITYTPFEQAIKHHEEINPALVELVEILG